MAAYVFPSHVVRVRFPARPKSSCAPTAAAHEFLLSPRTGIAARHGTTAACRIGVKSFVRQVGGAAFCTTPSKKNGWPGNLAVDWRTAAPPPCAHACCCRLLLREDQLECLTLQDTAAVVELLMSTWCLMSTAVSLQVSPLTS
jgi:hypothetical protein